MFKRQQGQLKVFGTILHLAVLVLVTFPHSFSTMSSVSRSSDAETVRETHLKTHDRKSILLEFGFLFHELGAWPHIVMLVVVQIGP